MPSFLQYPYTRQMYFVWEGIAQVCEYQEVRITEMRDSVRTELELGRGERF